MSKHHTPGNRIMGYKTCLTRQMGIALPSKRYSMFHQVTLTPKTKGLTSPLSYRCFLHTTAPQARFSSRTGTGELAVLPNSCRCHSMYVKGKSLLRVGMASLLQHVPSIGIPPQDRTLSTRELAPYPQPSLYPALRLEAQGESSFANISNSSLPNPRHLF